MKIISWNINGIRACLKKGFYQNIKDFDADFICLQEVRALESDLDLQLNDYYAYWHSAEKKGYAGTMILSRKQPLNVFYGMHNAYQEEGRILTLEYEQFFLVCVYTPNSQRELTRLDYRQKWDVLFKEYLLSLDKPLIFCGDLNVAHQEIDLARPKENVNNAGFTIEERQGMSNILQAGFIDSFRYLYPDKSEAYSWFSYMHNARARNIGWRIDYICVSEDLKEKIIDAKIISNVDCSDHLPVQLDIDLKY